MKGGRVPQYKNGFIPDSLLVVFKRGRNKTDGDWWHALPPASYARHLSLVARAKARTGRTLEITDGFGAYRPYASQLVARRLYGIGAAWPGTSSHGGIWEGQQTAAMDYGNWAWVYAGHGGFEVFKADCAAVGLWAGAIMPERGYPYEPWHVIDLDPWSAIPAGISAQLFTPGFSKEDDDMRFVYVDDDGNGKGFWTLVNTFTGDFFPPVYDQAVADGWATFWGNARRVARQEFLNAISAIKATSR